GRPPGHVGATRREGVRQALHLGEAEAVVAARCPGGAEQAVASPVADRPGFHSQQPRRLTRPQVRIQRIPIQVVVDARAHPQDTFTTVASTGWQTGTGPFTDTDAFTVTGPTSASPW